LQYGASRSSVDALDTGAARRVLAGVAAWIEGHAAHQEATAAFTGLLDQFLADLS